MVRYLLFFLFAFWGTFGVHWLGESIYNTFSAIFLAIPQPSLEQVVPMPPTIAEVTFSPSLTHQEPNFYQ
jgi:hypothetical protein